jgi:hypothetical protein
MTELGLFELWAHVARLVVLIRMARLSQDLLCKQNPWRDWESRHAV